MRRRLDRRSEIVTSLLAVEFGPSFWKTINFPSNVASALSVISDAGWNTTLFIRQLANVSVFVANKKGFQWVERFYAMHAQITFAAVAYSLLALFE
jgi:hypothetical protein